MEWKGGTGMLSVALEVQPSVVRTTLAVPDNSFPRLFLKRWNHVPEVSEGFIPRHKYFEHLLEYYILHSIRHHTSVTMKWLLRLYSTAWQFKRGLFSYSFYPKLSSCSNTPLPPCQNKTKISLGYCHKAFFAHTLYQMISACPYMRQVNQTVWICFLETFTVQTVNIQD